MPRTYRKRLSKLPESDLRRKNSAQEHHPTPDDLLLQPWFLSRSASTAIRRLIPRQYDSRVRWYFEDYGCFNCRKKNVLYGGNGFCIACRALVRRRLVQSMKRRTENPPIQQLPEPRRWFFSRAAAAEKLLSEFVKENTRGKAGAPVLRVAGLSHGAK